MPPRVCVQRRQRQRGVELVTELCVLLLLCKRRGGAELQIGCYDVGNLGGSALNSSDAVGNGGRNSGDVVGRSCSRRNSGDGVCQRARVCRPVHEARVVLCAKRVHLAFAPLYKMFILSLSLRTKTVVRAEADSGGGHERREVTCRGTTESVFSRDLTMWTFRSASIP